MNSRMTRTSLVLFSFLAIATVLLHSMKMAILASPTMQASSYQLK